MRYSGHVILAESRTKNDLTSKMPFIPLSSEIINNKLDEKVLTTITPYESLWDQNDMSVLFNAFAEPDPNTEDILKNKKTENQLSLTTSFPQTRSLNDSLEVLIQEFDSQSTKYPETKSFSNQLRSLAQSLDSPSAFEDSFIKNEILAKQPNLRKFMNKDIIVETTAVPTSDKSTKKRKPKIKVYNRAMPPKPKKPFIKSDKKVNLQTPPQLELEYEEYNTQRKNNIKDKKKYYKKLLLIIDRVSEGIDSQINDKKKEQTNLIASRIKKSVVNARFDINFLKKEYVFTKLKYSRCPAHDIVSGGFAALFAGFVGFLISEKFGIELVDSGDFYIALMYALFAGFSGRLLVRMLSMNESVNLPVSLHPNRLFFKEITVFLARKVLKRFS